MDEVIQEDKEMLKAGEEPVDQEKVEEPPNEEYNTPEDSDSEVIEDLEKRIDESDTIPLEKSMSDGYPPWPVMKLILRRLAGYAVPPGDARYLPKAFPQVFGEEG